LADLQWMVYLHNWSPVSYRSSTGQGKFAVSARNSRTKSSGKCKIVRKVVDGITCNSRIRFDVGKSEVEVTRSAGLCVPSRLITDE